MENEMEATIILGLHWDNGNWGYIGIMENEMEATIILGLHWDNGKMETTVVYWGYIGIMENKMVPKP